MIGRAHKPERPPISIGRKLIYAVLVTIQLCVLLAVASETFLRVYYDDISHITGIAAGPLADPENDGGMDCYDATIGWLPRPGYRTPASVPFRATINSQGIRAVCDYAPRPPPGIQRIAVLGDSCTFGEEVDDHQTIPHYMAQQLQDVEVLNFGVGSYGAGQMALRLEREGFAFHPDHVVMIILLPSDPARDVKAVYTFPKPVFRGDAGGRLRILNVPVPRAADSTWLRRYCYTTAWLFGRPRETPADELTLGEVIDTGRAIIRRVKEQCDAKNVDLTVVFIIVPSSAELLPKGGEFAEFTNYLRQYLRIEGVDTLDGINYLQQIARGPEDLEAEHGHWTARGNDLIARMISQHLTLKYPRWRLKS